MLLRFVTRLKRCLLEVLTVIPAALWQYPCQAASSGGLLLVFSTVLD
jgi:hypothetical protein